MTKATSALCVWLTLLACCEVHTQVRALAVGGIHELNGVEMCRLVRVEPNTALENLQWADALVVRARSAGAAEMACGRKRVSIRIVQPARLELQLVDTHVAVGRRFQVRAIARDGAEHELEIGKWTDIAWIGNRVVISDEDSSASEFGLRGGSFGVHTFMAAMAGAGIVEARLGEAVGTLHILTGTENRGL